jgi:hypothetical protein
MPSGQLYRVKRRTLPVAPRRGLNVVERKQAKKIARQVVNRRTELKYRNFLYPKTDKNVLNHNEVHILFGEDQANGLLNTGMGATGGGETRPIPAGDGVPYQKPGDIREGNKILLKALKHRLQISSAGISPSITLRLVMFDYPCTEGLHIVEADLLAQPTGTGAGQGWPNILMSLNRWNSKGIRFLAEKYVTMNGQPTPGAVSEEGAENWGEGPQKVVSFNKYYKNGKVIKYREQGDTTLPQYRNIGMFIVAAANYTTPQNQAIGNFEMNCAFEFKDM